MARAGSLEFKWELLAALFAATISRATGSEMKLVAFNNWLSDKGAIRSCPFCDTNEWIGETSTSSDDDLVAVAVISSEGASEAMEDRPATRTIRRHECFLLTCSNCGFVRLHNVKVVNPDG
jgi:hypothetical protein